MEEAIRLTGIALLALLCYGTYKDITSRIIPDKVPVLIIFLALIKERWDLLNVIWPALTVFFLCKLFFDAGYMGGGDVKLYASLAGYLGLQEGMYVYTLSMFIAFVYLVIKNRKCLGAYMRDSVFALKTISANLGPMHYE